MPKVRYVDKLSERERIYYLFQAISSMLGDRMSDRRNMDRTDSYGYAKQYLGSKWKVDDFDEIKYMTIEEIVNKFEDKK